MKSLKALLGFLWSNSQSRPRVHTYSDPFMISRPHLGLHNLLGASAADLIAEDQALFSPLFPVTELTEPPSTPNCDVLLLYCNLAEDGQIEGSSRGLRDIIIAAGARVAVVATPNSIESYTNATQPDGPDATSLIMTIDRKGASFGHFFAKLFASMNRGETMPVALHNLAPQFLDHVDCPATICLLNAGQITFAKRA